jgi:IS30 family transposase
LVRQIRARSAAGETATSIAADLGVGATTIDRVIRRERWSHVE